MTTLTRYVAALSLLAASAAACGGKADVAPPAGDAAAGSAGTAGFGAEGGVGGSGASGPDATVDANGGTGGSAGEAVDAGTDASGCNCGPLEECFDNRFCVAKSVPVPGGYSIDATEVTYAQYKAWLHANPSTSTQPEYCSWNIDFWPDSDCSITAEGRCYPDCSNYPVVCVNWCDADAYCGGIGKRLCGRIAPTGGTTSQTLRRASGTMLAPQTGRTSIRTAMSTRRASATAGARTAHFRSAA